ncbi:MAG: hypothetical protein ABIX46_02320 [Burkholderiaceae bacterium]
MRLVEHEPGQLNMPTSVFYRVDSAAPHEPPACDFGRAALAAYVEGVDGRLVRSMKSLLGSTLIEQSAEVGGARRVRYLDGVGNDLAGLRRAATAHTGHGIDRVVLGRPVSFVDDDPVRDAAAQAALESAARQVGIREVRFRCEPIAAADDYERCLGTEQRALVADVGGGTSDSADGRTVRAVARQHRGAVIHRWIDRFRGPERADPAGSATGRVRDRRSFCQRRSRVGPERRAGLRQRDRAAGLEAADAGVQAGPFGGVRARAVVTRLPDVLAAMHRPPDMRGGIDEIGLRLLPALAAGGAAAPRDRAGRMAPRLGEVAVAQVAEHRSHPGRATSGGVQTLLAGRAALHVQQPAQQAQFAGEFGSRLLDHDEIGNRITQLVEQRQHRRRHVRRARFEGVQIGGGEVRVGAQNHLLQMPTI